GGRRVVQGVRLARRAPRLRRLRRPERAGCEVLHQVRGPPRAGARGGERRERRRVKRTLGVLLACMLAAPAAAQDGGRSAPDGGIPPASAIEGRPLPEGHPPVEAAEAEV